MGPRRSSILFYGQAFGGLRRQGEVDDDLLAPLHGGQIDDAVRPVESRRQGLAGIPTAGEREDSEGEADGRSEPARFGHHRI